MFRSQSFSIGLRFGPTLLFAFDSSSRRCCSSSSSSPPPASSSSLNSLINVALGVIPLAGGKWLRLSSVASALPDDFLELIPEEVGGLRGLLEAVDPATAVIKFRKNPVTGALEVQRAMPLAPAPPPAPSLIGVEVEDIASSSSFPAAASQQQQQQQQQQHASQRPVPEGKREETASATTTAAKRLSAVHSITDVPPAPPPPPPELGKGQKLPPTDLAIVQELAAAERKEQRRREAEAKQRENESWQKAESQRIKSERQLQRLLETSIENVSAMSPLDEERARLRCIPVFPVPIAAVAEELARTNANGRGDTPSAPKNDEADDQQAHQEEDEATRHATKIKNVQQFIASIAPHRALIDIFAPHSDPWAALQQVVGNSNSASNSNTSSLSSLTIDDFFVCILEPFVSSHANPNAEATYAEHRAQEYDLYRLARFLSTEFFVSANSIRMSDVGDILEKDVLHIIASFPRHLEYCPPGAALPDGMGGGADDATDVETMATAEREYVLPPVRAKLKELPAPPASFGKSEAQGGNSVCNSSGDAIPDEEVKVRWRRHFLGRLGSVRYIVPSDQISLTTKCSRVFRNASLDELMKALHLTLKASRSRPAAVADAAPEDMGILPTWPTGPRRQAYKHEISRAILLKKFPKANVWFDRSVLAYFIFDTIPNEEAIDFEEYKGSFLGFAAKHVTPTNGNFLECFPHLFHSFQEQNSAQTWYIQRADSQHKITGRSPDDVTEEEILVSIMAARPKKIDATRPFQCSTITYKLTKVMIRALKTRFGGLLPILLRHPDKFIVVDNDGGRFFFKELCTQEVRQKIRDAGQFKLLDEVNENNQVAGRSDASAEEKK